jgi:serine/threonine protein kinase
MEIAVKVSKPRQRNDGLPPDRGITSADLQEIGIMVRLQHPNVNKILSIGFDDNNFYSTMELARGTLESEINSHNDGTVIMPEFQKIYYMYQMMCGVDYCLSRNVLHRDLKPANILIMYDGTLKIADYGLSISLSCVPDSYLSDQVVTLWYRAPEVLLEGKYQEGVDKWSVGCIIYELFRGVPAFPVGSEDAPPTEADELHQIFLRKGMPAGDDYLFLSGLPGWDLDKYDGLPVIHPDHIFPTLRRINSDIWEICTSLLRYRPDQRPSLTEILRRDVFDGCRDYDRSIGNPPREISRSYNCVENLELRMATLTECADNEEQQIYKSLMKGYTQHADLYRIVHPGRVYLHAVDIYQRIKCLRPTLRTFGANPNSYLIAAFALAELWCNFESLEVLKIEQVQAAAQDIITTLQGDFLRATAYDFLVEYIEAYSFKSRIFGFTYPILGAKGKNASDLIYFISTLRVFKEINQKELGLVIILISCIVFNVQFLHMPYLPRLLNILEMIEGEVKTYTGVDSKMWKAFWKKVKDTPLLISPPQ